MNCDECGEIVINNFCISCGLEHIPPIRGAGVLKYIRPLENSGRGSFQLNTQLTQLRKEWKKKGLVVDKKAELKEWLYNHLLVPSGKKELRKEIQEHFNDEIPAYEIDECIRWLKDKDLIKEVSVPEYRYVNGYSRTGWLTKEEYNNVFRR